jgi:hypothetical protein
MLLSNGAMIKNDVIEAFNKATTGGINWNFVDADLNLELSLWYTSEYLYECFEVLVDNFFGETV